MCYSCHNITFEFLNEFVFHQKLLKEWDVWLVGRLAICPYKITAKKTLHFCSGKSLFLYHLLTSNTRKIFMTKDSASVITFGNDWCWLQWRKVVLFICSSARNHQSKNIFEFKNCSMPCESTFGVNLAHVEILEFTSWRCSQNSITYNFPFIQSTVLGHKQSTWCKLTEPIQCQGPSINLNSSATCAAVTCKQFITCFAFRLWCQVFKSISVRCSWNSWRAFGSFHMSN